MKFYVTYKQLIDKSRPDILCKVIKDSDTLRRMLDFFELSDFGELISIVPVHDNVEVK